MKPTDRKYHRTDREILLEAAIKLAEEHGYLHVTRKQIADATGSSPTNVSVIFGTMPELKRAIVSAAIARGNLPILAQALVMKHPKAMRAPEALRRAAAATIGG